MMRITSLVIALASLAAYGCGDDESSTTASTSTSSSSTGGSGGAGGAAPDTVTLTTYMGATQANVLFVAAQDGDAEWQPLTGADGAYSFETSSGRFGIAYVCQEPGSTGIIVVSVVQATTTDFTSLVRVCQGPAPTTTTPVGGTVAGLGMNETAVISMGPYGNAADIIGPYQMDVPQGTWDMVAIRNAGSTGTTDSIILRRDIAVGGTAVTQNFNFATEGVATELRTMTIENAMQGETIVVNSFLVGEDGAGASLSAPTGSIAVVPTSALTGDDTHLINCFVSSPANGLRGASTFAKSPPASGITFTLLDPMVATVTVVASTAVQLEGTFGTVDGAQSYGMAIGQNTTTARRLFVDLSPSWLGTGSMLGYTTPDLSSLAGWNPSWELAPGEVTDWFASAVLSTGPADFNDDPTPGSDPSKEGIVTRSAVVGGQLTP